MSQNLINPHNLDKPFVRGSYFDVYVTLETAKLLKELNFESPVRLSVTEYLEERDHDEDGTSGPFGWEKGELEFGSGFFQNNSDSDYSNESYVTYALPTQSIVQMWLRQVHGIKVWVTPNSFDSSGKYWWYNVLTFKEGKLVCEITDEGELGLHFVEALEMGLIEGLKSLKKIKEND